MLIVYSFLSPVRVDSLNWPALLVWVLIVQLVEHCIANLEATGSNPEKFSGCFAITTSMVTFSFQRFNSVYNTNGMGNHDNTPQKTKTIAFSCFISRLLED